MEQIVFHNELNSYIKAKDLNNANNVVMRELGNALIREKQDFVDLLVYSGIQANNSMTDRQLVDNYIDNIDTNEKLLIGSAFLVNKNNQKIGFDGEHEINDNEVKKTILVLNSYFDNSPPPETDPNEDFYATSTSPIEEDDFYGFVGAIAGALGEGGKIANKIIEGKQKTKFGASDMVQKKQDAKAQLTSQIMAQRQVEIEAKNKKAESQSKTTKTLLYVGGGVVALAIVGVIIYMVNKSKQK